MKVSRRRFLQVAGMATVTSAIAACAVAPSPEGEGAAEVAELVANWGGWTPTQSQERSEDNPIPHDNILQVLEAYQDVAPNTNVEWIRVPSAMGGREWTIAQQNAGTIPHITPQAHWHVKDDLDKNWWQELTPFMNAPNPHIPSGEPGSSAWVDQFFPIPTKEILMRDGYYNMVFGLITTFFYYNVDWFNELGLSGPSNYAEFLEVCQAFLDEGVRAYGGWTGSISDTDHWYRLQLGGMVFARDVEPLVNPDRDNASYEEVACAIENGIYQPDSEQYREWLRLWKLNVPYRPEDWTVRATDSHAKFLTKHEPIMENGTWSFPRLLTDPLVDFEWDTFFAPLLTAESSAYVTEPPGPSAARSATRWPSPPAPRRTESWPMPSI